MKTKGQIAYEAYCEAVNWMSIKGEILPTWKENKKQYILLAWEQAALAVIYEVCKDCDEGCVNFIEDYTAINRLLTECTCYHNTDSAQGTMQGLYEYNKDCTVHGEVK